MFIDLTLCVDLDDPIVQRAKSDPKNWFMSQGHFGTHLDVCPGQQPPPAEYCLRRGLLIDASASGKGEIAPAALDGKDICEGDFLIFYTGHLDNFSYGSQEYFAQQPLVSWDVIDRLAESRISLIGLDFPGLRPGKEHGRADMRCGEHGKYVIENLNNVARVRHLTGDRPFQVITGWTGFKGSTGLSCRVTAMVH